VAKTREQLEKECAATIKLILSEMETLASMPPAAAGEPDGFDERRRRVVRKVWHLFKECLTYGAEASRR
jgi:hypothetical protein